MKTVDTTSDDSKELTPESGTHLAAVDYARAEARTLSGHGVQCPLADTEIHKASLGDLIPYLFEDGGDLADSALHSIRMDLELIALAIEEDFVVYDVVHRLIKLQDRARVASELHRRMKAHQRASAAPSAVPSVEPVPRSVETWEVGATGIERAFHGIREAVDHLQICLIDALKDERPVGIEECAASALEDVARWSLDFRTNLDAVRDRLIQASEAKRVAS